jgi:hypothetical protein
MTGIAPTVDQLAELSRNSAQAEVCALLKELRPSDLTAVELLGMLGILRASRDRQRPAGDVLTLVRPR